MSRKKPSQTTYRYDKWNGEINFEELKKEIEARQNCPVKLYSFIHHSQDLRRIVESLHYSRSNLRNHLLLMVNLTINDFYDKRIEVMNGKIKKRGKHNISSSASEGDELVTATDAEKHSFPEHNNAESKSPTNSMRKEA
ncbi:MAG: hypothetical protein KGD59_11835 [Candidatus Heimdallarchaeota archaeon]|nr:hypothetical protein [Candidatus Heimdallarchaeota archaeon]MBY8995234.1 hypothetical protein [Candidatus Heimdallarchaeota archaeon]